MMMNAVLWVAMYAAAVVIFGEAVVALNHIDRHGSHTERFCSCCAAVGSFGILAGPLCRDNWLTLSIVLVAVGVVGMILLRRRDAIMAAFKRVWRV